MILIINNNNTREITIGKKEEWKVEMTDKNSSAVVLISISQLIMVSANRYNYYKIILPILFGFNGKKLLIC